MQLSRRELLIASAASLVVARFARAEESALSPEARAALPTSPWIYVSALKRDGSESHCHAEVWFAQDGEGALVVTSSKAWRAQAVAKGLSRARIWVGQHGEWASGRNEAFRKAPSFLAEAKLETSQAQHDHALVLFGSKYTAEWGSWGPRFKKGLADGSRVLIRYTPVRG